MKNLRLCRRIFIWKPGNTCCLLMLLCKKCSVDKFFEYYSCHFRITPYNAPPLTRNNGRQAAGSAGFLRKFWQTKSENKCLTLKEENVLYGTSKRWAKAAFQLLFNNLSDNLCGHSKWHGFLMSSDTKWIPSLMSEHVIHYDSFFMSIKLKLKSLIMAQIERWRQA